jgi:hypothetical protein
MTKQKKKPTAQPSDLRSTMRAIALYRGLSIINEQMDAMAPTGDATATPPPPVSTNPAAPAPTGDVAPPPPADGAPAQNTAESLVKIFNEIRAGRSFDDPAVFNAFTTYFNATPEPTRAMLDTELRKIAEVVKPQNAAQPESAAPPPAAPPPAAPAAPPTPAQPAPGAPPVPTI